MKIEPAKLWGYYRQSFSWQWVKHFWPVYAFCCVCSLHAYGFLILLYTVLSDPDREIHYQGVESNPHWLSLMYFLFAHKLTDFIFDFLIIQSAVYIGYYWYKKNMIMRYKPFFIHV